MHIELLSTSLNKDSCSRKLLHRLAPALQVAGAKVDFFDALDLPPALCDGRSLKDYPAPYTELHERLAMADGVIIGTPIHNYSVSGPCLNVLAISGTELSYKPVAVVSASGSIRSHLAIGPLLVSLILGFRVVFYPGTIQVSRAAAEGSELDERISAFANDFQHFVASLAEASVGNRWPCP